MTIVDSLVAITGNTYPVKEQLKALGARWNADAKAWMVTPDKAAQAQAIVAGAGPVQRRYTVTRRSWVSGGGAWNGCSMGCREGNPNPRCRSCMFDEYDN
jgi:hypothetical protein